MVSQAMLATKTGKIVAALGAVIVLTLVGIWVQAAFFGPSDRTLIMEALDEATTAAKEGRPSPVLERLSSQFNYGDYAPARFDIAKVIRDSKPDITILNKEPNIQGDTATVVSDVRLVMAYIGQSMDTTVPQVTITLRHENAMSYLVIPTKKWRITEVQASALPSY